MENYLFALGRNPQLSLLELVSFFKNNDADGHIVERSEEFVLASLPNFNASKAIKQLGGVLKIAKVLDNDLYLGSKNKVTFAVNWFKSDPSIILKQVKGLFKELGLKATQKFAKSRTILPTKAKGLDIELIAYKGKLFKVVASSNPKEYKERDEKRPVFNPLKVTSIRFAKILINLAQPKKEIFDPFCGTGTILQEASLMGYSSIGLDRQIVDARKNLRWLQKKFVSAKGKWDLIQGDAARLSKRVKTIECVVTEPYLGPFFKRPPLFRDAIKISRELEQLYTKVLSELHKVVKNKVVILIPQLKTKERKLVFIPMAKILRNTGFKVSSPTKQVTMPLMYDDVKNNVQRLIYILEKV
jgi:tRNA G10  N-methylase Trm11